MLKVFKREDKKGKGNHAGGGRNWAGLEEALTSPSPSRFGRIKL